MSVPKTNQHARDFSTDEARWQAVAHRNATADGAFCYAVKTTGVYCRPGCPARLALRKNVRFFASCEEAELAGYRACQRCKPSEVNLAQQQAAMVTRACRAIEESDEAPSLAELAKSVGLSTSHFQRLFKAQTGVTPKDYAAAQRAKRVRSQLDRSSTVTQAIYGAGYQSNGRFYADANQVLGMTPKAFRAGGQGTTIHFAIGHCWLGSILVAASEKGVCAILLGDDPDQLARDLADRFPRAELVGGDSAFEQLVATVVGFVETPGTGLDLPLDIRGTAFQQKVWKALCKIPPGSTTTYAEIARRIGRPTSSRAVGQAIGANPLAVAIPCHRVIRTDGSLSGYRWGVERKDKLLGRERPLTA